MNDNSPEKNKINQETAKMPWHELQRFFAKGDVLFVESSEDLVEVAYHMAKDNLAVIKPLMESKKLHLVTDEQAQLWHKDNQMLWTVVIKPWLLVQPVSDN